MNNFKNMFLEKIRKETGIKEFLGYETDISTVFYTREDIKNPKLNYLKVDVETFENPLKKTEPIVFYKYLKYKGNETSSSFFDYYNKIKDKLGFYDVCIGVNGKTGRPIIVELAKNPYTHYSFIGQSGSGKSVAILWQLFQLYQKKNTEFYILKKSDGDFNIMFENLKKIKLILNSDLIEREDFESFNNYLELEKIRRSFLFKKWGVGNYRDYQKKFNNGGEEEGMENINLGIIVFDEYETARSRLYTKGFDFDTIVSQWLNVFRSFGFVVIFGTQTFQKDNLGPIREGMSMHWCGNTSYVLTDNKLIKNNIQNGYINGTNSFININSGEFMKTPYNDENSVTNFLKELEEIEDIVSKEIIGDKYTNGYLLLNNFISKNRELLKDSKIIYYSLKVFNELKIDLNYIEKLKKTSHYIPFLVLCFSIYIGYKRNIISSTFNLFERPDLSENIDRLLFDYIEKYRGKDYNDFIKELKMLFEDYKEENFIENISTVLNLQIKRFSGIDDLFEAEENNLDNKKKL